MDTLDPEWTFDEKVSFLSNMATKTAKNCPILPIPIPEPSQALYPEVDEISLHASLSENGRGPASPDFALETGSLELELEFDGQEEE